jgi:predicted nucleotidyltransferase
MQETAQGATVLGELETRLRSCREVLFALLFGSRAAGGPPRPGSDWDVAVYLEEGLSARDRFGVRRRLIAKLEDIEGLAGLDLVVLNDAPALLGHRALQGEILFARDRQAYVRYFVRTLAASGDEAHYRDLHRKARRRRLGEGTFGRP